MEKIPIKKAVVLYAIQRKSDGAWSRGGTGPKWGKVPKTWSIGPFKNHLHLFSVDGYKFNVEKVEEVLKNKTGWGAKFCALPEDFTIYKLLHDKRFPYFNCEIVEIRPEDLAIIKRYPAEEWVWENAYKPHYHETWWLDEIKKFCKTYGKDFD